MLVNQIEAEHITQYMDVTAESEEAGLLFVFGTMLLEPAYIAADAFVGDRLNMLF